MLLGGGSGGDWRLENARLSMLRRSSWREAPQRGQRRSSANNWANATVAQTVRPQMKQASRGIPGCYVIAGLRMPRILTTDGKSERVVRNTLDLGCPVVDDPQSWCSFIRHFLPIATSYGSV